MAPKDSYETIPDVESLDSPIKPRRRKRTNVWLHLAFCLFVGSIVGAICVVLFHPKVDLGPEVIAARSRVHVDKDGAYTVTLPNEVPPDTTFAQLADQMLAPWYEALLTAVDEGLDPNTMKPSNVANTRQVFLMTRSLLDAFSPVYSEHSLWEKLRKEIDKGYEKIGHLQDLDHSGVDFTDEQLQKRLDDVLHWKLRFGQFQQQHPVRFFVYRGADPNQCTRHKSSHLFWGDIVELPCGRDLAEESVQHLGRVQLSNAATYWQTAHWYDTVVPMEREEQFHNLRKELRIFLDEYQLFGSVMLDDPDQDALDTLFSAQTKLGDINDHWVARQIYVTSGSHFKRQEKLAAQVDEMWADFKNWAQDHDLTQVIQ